MKLIVISLVGFFTVSAKHVVTLHSRNRAVRAENKRIQRYNAHASSRLGRSFEAIEEPEANHETTSVWDYPLTLDYVVDIAVNTSDKIAEYSVIVDSGSSNLALALASCSCGTGSNDLVIDIVSDECIEVTYGSGAWWGYETVAVQVGFIQGQGEPLMVSTPFAGIELQEDFFEGGGYSGILGLAYISLAESYSSEYCMYSTESQRRTNRPSSRSRFYVQPSEKDLDEEELFTTRGQVTTQTATPLLDVMNDNGLLNSNVFTLTFCSTTAEFAIGGVDETVTTQITYVDCQKTYDEFYGYYLVYLDQVIVDDTAIDVSSSDLNQVGGVLVDSGTTLIYLPHKATSKIQKQLEDSFDSDDAEAFFSMYSCVDEDQLTNLPDISLNLAGGYSLVLSPLEYTLNYGDCYYYGIASSDVGIIGNIALQNKIVVFDKTNNLIGFGDVNCDDSTTPTTSQEVVETEKKDTPIKTRQEKDFHSVAQAAKLHTELEEESSSSSTAKKTAPSSKGARRGSIELASSSLQLVTAIGFVAVIGLAAFLAKKNQRQNDGRGTYEPIKNNLGGAHY
mmetsp:Transcript_5295/g.6793  ORF Transcript_5295/g.6793 Transcript_5295/m.6793 type:complete len:563 (+) Transcript_5295:17-1705(+)